MSKSKWVNVAIIIVVGAAVIGGLTYLKKRQDKIAKTKAATATASTSNT